MAKRPPGRPQATNPRGVKIGLRLTEEEADMLQRLAKGRSPSEVLRTALREFVARHYGHAQLLPDTEHALVQRELRKAKRQATTDTAALQELFALDETDGETPATPPVGKPAPPADGPTTLRPQLILPPADDSPVPPAVVTHPVTGKRVTIPLQRTDPFAHRR
jgi:hypothetical protein